MPITKFTLLHRLQHVAHEQFVDHWQRVHGPLAAALPEFWKYNTRYFQNTPRLQVPQAPRWDGIAQTEQVPRENMARSLYDEAVFMQVIRPDEGKFLDIARSQVLFGEQHMIKDGPREGFKILAFLHPAPGVTLQAFQSHWLDVHAPLVQSVEGFWKHVRRYVQFHTIPSLTRTLAQADQVDSFAGVGELWFDDAASAQAALNDRDYLERIRPDERAFAGKGSVRLPVHEREIVR
jgi:uncharacterized protein (TIGR02118 family)